jgi:hypothetical protein
MDPIPKDRQGDSSDEEEEDTRIPKEIRDKKKRLIMEENGGKMPVPHHEEAPEAAELEGDGQSDKQKAEAGVK